MMYKQINYYNSSSYYYSKEEEKKDGKPDKQATEFIVPKLFPGKDDKGEMFSLRR